MTTRRDPIHATPVTGTQQARGTEPGLTVADRMTRPAITVGWAEPVADAARVMEAHGIRHLPVVEADGCLIGILTQSDVREILASEGIHDAATAPPTLIVGKAMSVEPVAVPPDSELAAAVTLMYERKLSALPVVEAERVVGILAESDILRAFAHGIRGERTP
jgi:CBS domain-containing protein